MGLLRRKRQQTDVVIDLRDPTPAPHGNRWGSPIPCPECSGRGYLDHIDPFREVMYMHCTACGHRYEVTRAELAARG